MRPPAQIKPYYSVEKMFKWLQNAPDEQSYKRRMAIWLTHTSGLNASKVAGILNVSTQAVWLWISQYNHKGPDGLDRKGRGGRRWAFMTYRQETDILKLFIHKAKAGQTVKTTAIKQVIENKLGKKISMSYIYRLLKRHKFNDITTQSQRSTGPLTAGDNFRKLSRPWLRNI